MLELGVRMMLASFTRDGGGGGEGQGEGVG